MSIPTRRRRLSDEQRATMKTQLSERFTRPERTGLSKRLFTGEDVERYVSPILEDFKSQKDKDIEKRIDEVAKKFSARADAVLAHLVARIERAIAAIPVPENGRTPTEEEVRGIIAPIIEEVRTSLDTRLANILDRDPNSVLPKDDEVLEGMLKDAIKKYAPKRIAGKYGGSGPVHFYDIVDVPGKTERYGPAPYRGYENKYLRVKTDGSGLEWVDISVGGANVATDTVTATDAGGNTVDIDLTQLSHPWTTVQMVIRNGAIQNKNKWSIAGDVLTLTGAVPTNDFQVQFTYA